MTTPPPSQSGTLGVSKDGAFSIHFDRTLKHPLHKVWAALIDPEKLSVWLPGCRIDPHVGGQVLYDFGDEGQATGEVLTIQPATTSNTTAELVHTWCWDGLPDSIVTWRLESVSTGTRLQLIHSEVLREPAVEFAVGWHLILDTLERNTDERPWDDVWDHAETLDNYYRNSQ